MAIKPLALFRHPLFLCSLSFACCFLLGLLLFLPLQPLTSQLEELARQQGLELRIEQPRIGFPFKLKSKEISIHNPLLPYPPIPLSDISLAPQWLSLLGDAPGFNYQLKLWQGEVTGAAFLDGRVEADLDQLQIDEQLSPQLPLNLTGQLTKGNFSGQLPLARGNNSQLSLSFSELQLSGLNRFGSRDDILPIGQLECSAELNGRRLSINRCQGAGPALAMQASGQINIGQTPAATRLNLTLTLTPQAGLDPLLKEMLSLIKKPLSDGRIEFKVIGSLANPRIR